MQMSVYTVSEILLTIVTDRLKAFLPQLQAANTLLDRTKNIEDVEEDEEYVEMVCILTMGEELT